MQYAEPFFQALGCKYTHSLDASGFEGATIIHDLNTPIPPVLHKRYDLVYDGGTIEHVFNFPQALRNLMSMVTIGGTLIIDTAGNSKMGHGFYQFSPEVFVACMESGGFRLERLLGAAMGMQVVVKDVTQRREIASRSPIILHVEAVRSTPNEIGPLRVQQGHYEKAWDSGSDQKYSHAAPKWVRDALLRLCPQCVRAAERFVDNRRRRF